ncbi:aldehyde dehydrogenase family protein [Halodesulfurarchaeum formicicum]|uniref:Aldehyde dehydrogenase (NAD+) n=1 Tax=Halodesulfurarchaeum formicicum TaxID=1873524 RepID=A0A1J1AEB9_9EURY|nr:aldehyde dehydrogenase family protein [Halodesulfurarchaeum formicicum]APE96490.1 aldehyde dehydrogenase (NAD+) [Halodesulfurarchaeum formicicum]
MSEFSIDADWNALYIDGEWTDREETMSVEDPSTREPITDVPAASEADVDAAYEAAAAAQADWADQPPTRKAAVTQEVAELLQTHAEDIIKLLRLEGGSSTVKANIELESAVGSVLEAASFPSRMKGEHADSIVPEKENIVERVPQGVITVISPWNFPLILSMRAVDAAIATGNSVVLKPASNTPITGGLLLARLYEEAGLPDGVLNVVTGEGSVIGDHVASHPESDVVAFTGSTAVGRHVAGLAGENLAVPAMELGGNGVHLVTDDADVDAAVEAGAFGTYTHQGQICMSINRHVVHEAVYDEYVEKLTAKAAGLPTGSVHDPETIVGPIIDETQRESVRGLIEDSIEAGATVETGGETVPVEGVEDSLVLAPTVLSGVTNDMPVAANEHFGPVAPVIRAESVDAAIEIANDTEYGLSSSVYAGNLDRGREIADQLETGMVHVNDQPVNDEPHVPFGGMKASGIGRYNAEEVISEFTQTKWISLQHEPREYPY